MKTRNKFLPILLIFSMIISLIGCGSSTNPVAGEDVVENIEQAVESTEATVESSDGTTIETGEKGDAVVDADKPTETLKPSAEPSATGKPESTAEPTASSTEKPQTTATPEPTQPPHTHDYKVESSVAATCATEGKVVKVCSCGETQTEVVPATGNHTWVEEMEVVTVPSTGHMETIEQQVQVGTTETRHEYECSNCGATFDTPSAVVEHCKATGDFDHAFASTIIHDYPGEPIYETQTQNVWIEDTPETTTTVGTGRFTCSTCGATK